ncbi:hypothetical protein LTR08_000576 [Meristemomyces frigidus]|nr:hypothetical protein LTR08_000576 [Meristemomyces frigidus]
MSGEKRAASSSFGSTQLVKRQRSDANLHGGSNALVQGAHGAAALQAPVMQLSGHSAEVFAARFSPTAPLLASASADRSILLWSTTADCANTGLLTGHKSAVLDLHWSRDGGVLYSCSADAHVASWDATTGARIRRHTGHAEAINSLAASARGEEFLVSGSDDGSIGVWDPRQKHALAYLATALPVTAVCLAAAGHELYSGAIDNTIRVWDLRAQKCLYELAGHADTITSLALAPDAQTLLSNSHDSTARTWDVRPFAPEDRALRVLDGAQAGLEKNLIRACWDGEGKRVAAGGGDGTVTVWDSKSGLMLHKLPGHRGTVNDVRISPDGSMVLSASTDRTMLLGELPR